MLMFPYRMPLSSVPMQYPIGIDKNPQRCSIKNVLPSGTIYGLVPFSTTLECNRVYIETAGMGFYQLHGFETRRATDGAREAYVRTRRIQYHIEFGLI